MAGESMEEAGRLRRLQATYERAWIGAAAADGDDKREDSDQGKGLDGGGCRFWGEETMREHGISVLRARGRAQCWLETKARARGLEEKVGS